jgi:hypothetical protein
MMLGARSLFKNKYGSIRQRSNVENYWARDASLTNSRWSLDDFILHEWKERCDLSVLWHKY